MSAEPAQRMMSECATTLALRCVLRSASTCPHFADNLRSGSWSWPSASHSSSAQWSCCWAIRATASLMGPSGGADTGEDGRFSIAEVPAGTYRLNASVPIRMDHTAAGGSASVTWTDSGGSGGSNAGGSNAGGAARSGGGGIAVSGVGGVVYGLNARSGGSTSIEVVVTDTNVTGIQLTVRRPQQ